MKRRKKISLARETLEKSPWLSKRGVARTFGIARSTLYLKSKQAEKDKTMLELVLEVIRDHPHYGHRRIALVLSKNPKAIYRVMRKYNLKARKRRKRPRKRADEGKSSSGIPNRIKDICPIRPGVIFVRDFTYLDWKGMFIYFATVLDRYTREVVGFSIGLHHSAKLVIEALEGAIRKRGPPMIFHSDQGSEYDSKLCMAYLLAHRILPSQSHKAHPWENGHQESFYGRFKEELGNLNRFDRLDQLIEAICLQLHYYNTKRIHSKLKMTPRQKYEQAVKQLNLCENKEKTPLEGVH